MAMDKRTWVNIAAGTVAVLAIVFGVKQCNDKEIAREQVKAHKESVRENNETAKNCDISNVICVLDGRINELTDSLQTSKEIIAQKDSTIAVLRDSLDVCKTGKGRCPCTPKKTNNNTKPVAKPAPAKPAPAKPVAKPAPATPVVEVTSGEKKVVVYEPDAKPDQSVIVNGDNSGTIIVNANGIVENNDRKAQEQYKTAKNTVRIYGTKRVLCH